MKRLRTLLVAGAGALVCCLAPANATAAGGLTADFNNDNCVDSLDLVEWNNNFGSQQGAAYDGSNFLSWQRQLGSTSTPDPGVHNPEPATIVVWGTLVAVTGFGIAVRRRRERAALVAA